MENLDNDFASPRRTLMCSEIGCPCNATGGHLDGGRCRGCLDPETLANLCPGAKRQYVDCDTTVVDCEGSVMECRRFRQYERVLFRGDWLLVKVTGGMCRDVTGC